MTPSFVHRSNLPERMDDPALAQEELALALADIAKVNTLLGGYHITLDGIKKLMQTKPDKTDWTIVDVGCGDGQVLRYLAKALASYQDHFRFVGVDINPKSIAMARHKSDGLSHVSFEVLDILQITNDQLKADILVCNLTMHHFDDTQIVTFLKVFYQLAGVGVVINDLERSPVAYQLFRLFSRIFMKSDIARYDGKISIARGFKREELHQFASLANFKNYSIRWKWAFRFLWVIYK
ncbi:MAG: methyltransferase domain-containing protein [Dokdonia sp.]|jgi:ubiquinone/menaquinone biosynthesis C-methylase UbiE